MSKFLLELHNSFIDLYNFVVIILGVLFTIGWNALIFSVLTPVGWVLFLLFAPWVLIMPWTYAKSCIMPRILSVEQQKRLEELRAEAQRLDELNLRQYEKYMGLNY